jgi:hypothetical protein
MVRLYFFVKSRFTSSVNKNWYRLIFSSMASSQLKNIVPLPRVARKHRDPFARMARDSAAANVRCYSITVSGVFCAIVEIRRV